ISQLENADIDWNLFDFGSDNENIQKAPKKLRDYQEEAIERSLTYFKDHSRGKLIMAPGTGKTFTSLKIAEALYNQQGGDNYNILYMVPSIQLLSQTLFNWNSDRAADINMISFSVVSDRKATKKKAGKDNLSAKDVGFPATTNVQELMKNYQSIKRSGNKNITVIFSTYQSIDVIHQAQEAGYPEFDLIVADEAHRTTGAAKLGEDSMFTKVHHDSNVAGKLRLYQTATPKIYGADAKKKAESNSSELSSMDDPKIYGEEIYRLGFGEAVSRGYLTDYKVSVLAVNENYVNKHMQAIMRSSDNELQTSDIGKIIGIWNAMTKRNGMNGAITGAPMKRAIAFTDTIAHSKDIAKEFNNVVNDYLGKQAEGSFRVDVHHVDGGLNALEKKTELDWLAGDMPENTARILSNVRFLTEGIDVPNLDAIIFMAPKKSQVDIVQAVGRIMRRYEGKEYGYIILPIVIDANTDPASALDNNKKYQEVWQVLNALRSIDERFEAEINKLTLNKKKSGKLGLNAINTKPGSTVTEGRGKDAENNGGENTEQNPEQLDLDLEMDMAAIEQAFYGKIVDKVGDRRYLEDWSKDVANIAKRHIAKINTLIDTEEGAERSFDRFMRSLQHNINDSIDRDQAIEMLAQHLITQPIFQALFGEYSFINDNPVSHAVNEVVSAFSVFGFDKEQKELKLFYDSVKLRASEIDNAAAKQKFIMTLYDKFFRTGFKDTTEQMGIVFTPVEVVDFIVKSTDYALEKYFGKHLSDKGVHILDPFTGTGTFITRTLEYLKQQMDEGKITFDDILYKYTNELHANEIILLSYYIAAINIEAVFDEVNGPDRGYQPFEGIVLTDTFESTERNDSFMDELLGQNNARLKKQQEKPITAIISNPPYSVGQGSANDDNQNTHYPILEKRIEQTYVKNSTSSLSKSSYDSYIKAFRWATDRIGDQGVIGFITNSGYIDKGSLDGLRQSIHQEFNDIYVLNLRGAVKGKVKNTARIEGQNIFDIQTGVAIIILIKDKSKQHNIYYHDIGDRLSRSQKFEELNNAKSIFGFNWKVIHPDSYSDWINQRDPHYKMYPSIVGEEDSPVLNNAVGISTNRDIWVSGFSKQSVLDNSKRLIDNYNAEVLKNGGQGQKSTMRDSKKIKWSAGLDNQFKKGIELNFEPQNMRLEMYRPFTKKWLMYDRNIVERPGKYYELWGNDNQVIVTTGRGIRIAFSAFVTDILPNLDLMEKCQGFMRYDNSDHTSELIPDNSNMSQSFANKIGLSQDDTFAYVYGLLNSREYQQKYANDLKKNLARIPIVKDKEKYVEVGKQLMDLHINYEEVPLYTGVEIVKKDNPDYRVTKMKFAKQRNEEGKLVNDRSTLIYNNDITIKRIPEKVYEYVVNGRSAIEWLIDQYQVDKNKIEEKYGITDDPNNFSDDPKYIFNLVLRIINVSVQTVDLVNSLPKFEVIE
ncbi:type ISP restriction/modification enzyme, partial [Secundilactobacillus muriivasis]